MTENHRAVEPRNDMKSFVVFERDGVFTVKESHFVVGYTKAHCATPLAAISAAILKKRAEIIKLSDEVGKLLHMQDILL